LWRKTHFRNVLWEVQLVMVFFWHLVNNNVSCACPLQGANNASIRKMKMGKYQSAWQKTINTLKHNGHLLFEGQEIREGIHDEDIEAL